MWVGRGCVATVGAAMLLTSACKKDPEPSDNQAAVAGAEARGAPARLTPVKFEPSGPQPGYLEGASAYAMAVAGPAQGFVDALPLPDEAMRELGELRRDLGFDPVNDDLIERFSIPADGVVSSTLGRPLGTKNLDAVRLALGGDDRFLAAVQRELKRREAIDVVEAYVEERPAELARPIAPPEPIVEEIAPPPAAPIAYDPSEPPPPAIREVVPPSEPPLITETTVIGVEPPPPGPPPLSAAEQARLDELFAKAATLGMQFHFHLPTERPGSILTDLRATIPPKVLANGDEYCTGFEVELCAADGDTLFVVRREDKAVMFDALVFTALRDAPAKARRPAVEEALDAKPATLAGLEHLGGHASLYFDAQRWITVAEHEWVAATMRRMAWGNRTRADIQRRLDEIRSLTAVLDTQRLFDGLLMRAHHDGERSQLVVSWPLRPEQAALAARTLLPPAVHVPVPSLAALCDGALMCARSRGVPSPQALGKELATGVYADPDALEDAIRDTDDFALMVIMAATWPNALGTVGWHLPMAEARGPEAAFVRGAVDAVGRVQATGFRLDRLDVGRRDFSAQYGAFARVPVGDMSLARTLLAMAEQRPVPVDVEGLEGVSMVKVPDDDVPAALFFYEDPKPVTVDGEERKHGWMIVADKPERVEWLESMDTDGGEVPLGYFEIPDLWKLFTGIPEAMEDLAFARTWAMGRSFKIALILHEGAPSIAFELAK